MDKVKDIIVFGTGDFSDVLVAKMEREGIIISGYTVSRAWMQMEEYRGKPVYAFEDLAGIVQPEVCAVYLGIIGKKMFEIREKMFMRLYAEGYILPNYIAPSACVLTKSLGYGNIIMENVVVEEHCTIGNGNIIWPNVVLPHHNKVGDFNNLSPSVSLSGYAEIGNRCFIGNNASIKNCVRIHDCALVGAGVFVSRNLEKEQVLVSERSYILSGKKSYDFK